MPVGDSVGKRQLSVDGVVIAAAGARSRHVAGGDEFVDDSVRGAFGDADAVTDLA